MRIGSLFSGAGGLDMAVQAVFGGEIAWHCENDSAASKVLAYRYPDTPNHHDITAADWTQVVPIDVLCGGWPCQPFSPAGLKKGADDARALWPEVARAVRDLRPQLVVLENVADVVIRGELARAVGDLSSLGYDAQWICLRACDVGAPHRRDRLFIVATDAGSERLFQRPQLNSMAITDSQGSRNRRHPDGLAVETLRLLPTPRATDRYGAGRHGDGGLDLRTTVAERAGTVQWQQYGAAIARWESLTRPAPDPRDPVPTRVAGNPRINPQFSEWLMGWPEGWVTQVPGISRNDQLRIVGNGVVSQCAETAIRYLLNVAEVAA